MKWPPRENPVQTRNVSPANPAPIVLPSHVRLHSLRAFADGFESAADCRTQSKIRKITIAVVSIFISAELGTWKHEGLYCRQSSGRVN